MARREGAAPESASQSGGAQRSAAQPAGPGRAAGGDAALLILALVGFFVLVSTPPALDPGVDLSAASDVCTVGAPAAPSGAFEGARDGGGDGTAVDGGAGETLEPLLAAAAAPDDVAAGDDAPEIAGGPPPPP